jgi:hypothetical protein
MFVLNQIKKDKGRYCGAYSALLPLKADCTLAPEVVLSFISRGAPHQAAREASLAKEGNITHKFCRQPVILLQLLGSFTCPKVGTWDRLFNFPSEGRHAEDFYTRKNPTASEAEASMLTTRPPKPSFSQITIFVRIVL